MLRRYLFQSVKGKASTSPGPSDQLYKSLNLIKNIRFFATIPQAQVIVVKSKSDSHSIDDSTYNSNISNNIDVPPFSSHQAQPNQPITPQTEYKQLPDDSQYIDKYYPQLLEFFKELKINTRIPYECYSDFENDPEALIHYLERYIDEKKTSKVSLRMNQGSVKEIKSVNSSSDVKKLSSFLENVKITLRLNGGHTHVFDSLIQSQKFFKEFETKLKKRRVSLKMSSTNKKESED
ncbi:hypothetical protein WICPIJ_007711 [Wickerhamomyces pijperi]|uniref:Uncharacterized protein n=1 Tax=Wickerhamomyces pijperi TaxID=599730 RepID=A0A9P8PZG9_WICPI|nr:hypothetical protein WICPIJ_007711 [Wickerhamomyces pijperi]